MFTDDIKFLQKVVVLHPTENIFLALQRSKDDPKRANDWDLPGGNVLYGELHEDSLRREVMEEVQLEIEEIKPIQVITNYEKNIYYIFIGLTCKATSDQATLSKEHQDYKWVTKDEFFELTETEFLRDLVELAFV